LLLAKQVVMTRVWLKWLPAAVVPAVIAVGALAVPLQAGAAVDLPEKTPEQVLAMIGGSTVQALSGTVEQASELGLPKQPATGPSTNVGTAAALELLTGSHTARVYLDGPTNVRLQIMDRLAERDLVRQGNTVWLYNSADNTATHLTLPDGLAAAHPGTSHPGTSHPGTSEGPTDLQTPAQLAKRMLAAIDPGTAVTVGTDTTVAGRSAYDLVLTPRSSGTLVGEVSIAVDSQTGLPLKVEVQARGQAEPAFRVAFTDLSLAAPNADVFAFTPPAGATVTEQALPPLGAMNPGAVKPGAMNPGAIMPEGMTPGAITPGDLQARKDAAASMVPPVTVDGDGWDAVVELPAGTVPAELRSDPLFAQVTTAVPGGRLLSSALVNVLLTDDGRVFAGSVPAERLQTAAAGG
jgi:outer membrane lipoprotein-sorting protein